MSHIFINDMAKKTNLKFGSENQKNSDIKAKGLPTEGKEFSTLGKPDAFQGLSSQPQGLPRQDRAFSTLGILNRPGTYTNAKFNQALGGKYETIDGEYVGTQQLTPGGGYGTGLDTPKPNYIETFYILTEDGNVVNTVACSSGLPCTSGCEDIQDRLLWPV